MTNTRSSKQKENQESTPPVKRLQRNESAAPLDSINELLNEFDYGIFYIFFCIICIICIYHIKNKI